MNFAPKLTLLSEEEIWGVNGGSQLEVLKKYGTKSAITDLVILTGGSCDYSCTYMAPDDDSLKGRTGWWYTRSPDTHVCYGTIRSVYFDGKRDCPYQYFHNGAIRPALQSSYIFDSISPNRVRGYNGTEEVKYGEYPQYAPISAIQEILEWEYKNGYFHKTGKNYTFDSTAYSDCSFQPITYDEYESHYNGKKYIRIEARSNCGRNYFELSNGEKYKNGDTVWVEVSPVQWLIDDRTKTLLSKRGILSGIRFYTDAENYVGDFSTTDMKEYLDKYMLKDLTQSSISEEKVQYEGQSAFERFLEEKRKNLTDFLTEQDLEKIKELLTIEDINKYLLTTSIERFDELYNEYQEQKEIGISRKLELKEENNE